MIASTR